MDTGATLLIVSTSMAVYCFLRSFIWKSACCPIIFRYNQRLIKKPFKYFFITVRFVSIVSGFCAIAQFFVKKDKTIDEIHIVITGCSIGASAIQIINDIILLFINICEKPERKGKRILHVQVSFKSDIDEYHIEINNLNEELEKL